MTRTASAALVCRPKGSGRSLSRKQAYLVQKVSTYGGFEAELYKDSRHADLFHFVITRKGDSEILMWGQEPTYEEAESVAMSWMRAFSNKAANAG